MKATFTTLDTIIIKPESNEERLLLQHFKNNNIKISSWAHEMDYEGISSLTIKKMMTN
jgi:hypothetical protein